MFSVLSDMKPVRRRCRPCSISRKKCSRDLPSCQTCVRRGRPDLCVYEEISQQQYKRQRKRRRLGPNDQSTQSEEPSNHETKTQEEDCSGEIQPAIQRTDSEDPDVDTTPSTQERAEAKPILQGCHLESTRHEGNNSRFPTITHAILPDAEKTKPYFEMYLTVNMSGNLTFETLLADHGAD